MSKKEQIRKEIEKFLKKQGGNDRVKVGFMDEDDSIGKLEIVKTGVVPLDLVAGGLYKGKLNVWFGRADSGKSTCVRDTLKSVLSEDEESVVAYLDQEKTLDEEYWKRAGVDLERVIGARFDTADGAFDFGYMCVSGKIPVDVLAIDTLQALSPASEVYEKKKQKVDRDKIKSVEKDTVALIPRLYSQFLREYTSLVGAGSNLSLLLVSQVRTTNIGGSKPFDDMSGGNAIRHYAIVILKMNKASKNEWPGSEPMPENSFPVRFTIEKIKATNRHKGMEVMGYFYKGSFERKFNVVHIGQKVGVYDGKYIEYPDPNNPSKMIEIRARGVSDMYNKITDEAVDYIESKLECAFLNPVVEKSEDRTTEEDEHEDDGSNGVLQPDA